ncbi:hypothetical protein ACQ4PT_034147 [Festuca glaucescens]
MEMAAGVASWLVGKLLDKLSNDLVAAYVSSEELGLNSEQIKEDLLYMQALLHAAQGRDDNNPGLKGLLQQLARKADEAEDALDELHYFMIQDKLDNTHHVTPLLAGDIQEKVQHGRKAVRHTFGNWLSNLSCSSRKDDVCAAATAVTDNPQSSAKFDSANVSGHEDHLEFDTVVMSNKIKSVIEVGKIEHLEELKEFHVKKKSVGFELEELGKLTDLGGELCVHNLEEVATKEEASKANLVLKRNLKKLTLVCRRGQLIATDVVDGLQPHDNLKELVIKGDCAFPRWLCRDITIKHLESLTLDGVCWGNLPPFGHLSYLKILRLKNITGMCLIGPDLSFMHLKKVEFNNMPDLEEWVMGPNCHQFPKLESIKCSLRSES